MPVQQLKEFLDGKDVRYISVQHSPAYTAQEIAKSAHICGDKLAKTVIIDIDGHMSMVVLPASYRIRWDKFMKAMGTDFIELADEEEFQGVFPGCEVGAMPPFGHLFGMHVYMCDVLSKYDEIAFSSGQHGEVIKMSYKDYVELAHPVVMTEGFTRPESKKKKTPSWITNKRMPQSA
ncbi:MAG: YbaK/EbsC family protein [Hahellaceae bacterium]|jgi:Ala-tRNA(Pro) deacylase|nr:YbaK/EbsC family protein [Hahellaceae bacterium]MCP5210727.1 YbaK/EbsC family protein [Hahellaceae bacterium]